MRVWPHARNSWSRRRERILKSPGRTPHVGQGRPHRPLSFAVLADKSVAKFDRIDAVWLLFRLPPKPQAIQPLVEISRMTRLPHHGGDCICVLGRIRHPVAAESLIGCFDFDFTKKTKEHLGMAHVAAPPLPGIHRRSVTGHDPPSSARTRPIGGDGGSRKEERRIGVDAESCEERTRAWMSHG